MESGSHAHYRAHPRELAAIPLPKVNTLLGILTVREMLAYQSELKRYQSEPSATKRAAVEALLTKLGLQDVANSRIGSTLHRGISGRGAWAGCSCLCTAPTPCAPFRGPGKAGQHRHQSGFGAEGALPGA